MPSSGRGTRLEGGADPRREGAGSVTDRSASPVTAKRGITVAGAGIIGLWQALTLARAGHGVTLARGERGAVRQHGAAATPASCWRRTARRDRARYRPQRRSRRLGALARHYPELINAGSLVLTLPRDQPELTRFERLTKNYERIGCRAASPSSSPISASRFSEALYFPHEAHMAAPAALALPAPGLRRRGRVRALRREVATRNRTSDLVIDCRGSAAQDTLARSAQRARRAPADLQHRTT